MADRFRSQHSFLSEDQSAPNFTGAKLAELSNPSREELESYTNSFCSLPASQRLAIITKMVELAENNVELNFDAIFKYCLKDPDAEVRSQAIGGLWENEEISLIAPLLDLFTRDDSEKVRATAATALGRFILLIEQGTIKSIHLDRITTALMAVVNDPSAGEEVKRRSLEAVASLGVPGVKAAITEFYNSMNPRLKVSSIYAMGRSCDPVWLPILTAELKNADPEIRFEAATALGEQADPSVIPDLANIGGDPDSEVRHAVIQAMGKIGGNRAKEYLHGIISSRDTTIAELARQAMDELLAGEDPLSLKSLNPN